MIVRHALLLSAALVFSPAAVADIPPPSADKTAPSTADVPPAVGDEGGAKVELPTMDSTETTAPAAEQLTAGEQTPEEKLADSLVKRTGTVDLPGGQARVAIKEGFAYLNPEDTRKLLVELWGNPPEQGEGVLGAIVPADVSMAAPESWAAIITYENEGHVADDDAKSINYGDLMKQMQEDTTTANDERVKQGYEPISLVGWAQEPKYDSVEHKLYWAKHLQFGKEAHTLNYAIRALGRTGVLQVNVVAGMDQLKDINQKVPGLLSMVSFTEGNRYADFKDGDQVAAYGLAALIAGGVAAKAGLFKGLLALLAALWKPIAAGVLVLGGVIRRMFAARKDPNA